MTATVSTKLAAVTILLGLVILLDPFTFSLSYAQNDLFGEAGGPPDVVVKVTPLLSTTAAKQGSTVEAAILLEMEPGWHINSDRPSQSYLIPAELTFGRVDGLSTHGIKYPRPTTAMLVDERLSVFGDSTVIKFQIDVADAVADGDYVLPLYFQFQTCDDKSCLSPETAELELVVPVGSGGRPAYTGLFSSIDDASRADYAQSSNDSDQTSEIAGETSDLQRLIDEHGFWGYVAALGLAFVTGILLSFSPCTYPMIPITVSVFAGRDRSIGRGLFLSLMYVGSMAFVYGLMGLVVSLVGGVFGAWLSSPPVVIGIAIVFVAFALSMFGLYNLQIPAAWQSKLGGAGRGGGVAGSIVLGVVAALVVSPCVGPFVAGVLLYIATAGSPVMGFLVLFVFALGLGTLYLIIGTFSSAMSALPGAGGWMESVKRFFGFVLLLMAVYFLRTIIPSDVIAIITGLILLAFAVFGGGLDRLAPDSGMFARLKKFLGILAFILSAYLILGTIVTKGFILPPATGWLPSSGSRAIQEEESIPWVTDLENGLTRAASEMKPVLIDTWATWCVNCKVLEKKTFGNAMVIAEAERFVPIKIQLEKSSSETTKDFVSRFNIKQFSLPTTLLLDSQGNVRKILKGVVAPEDMVAEMRRIN